MKKRPVPLWHSSWSPAVWNGSWALNLITDTKISQGYYLWLVFPALSYRGSCFKQVHNFYYCTLLSPPLHSWICRILLQLTVMPPAGLPMQEVRCLHFKPKNWFVLLWITCRVTTMIIRAVCIPPKMHTNFDYFYL